MFLLKVYSNSSVPGTIPIRYLTGTIPGQTGTLPYRDMTGTRPFLENNQDLGRDFGWYRDCDFFYIFEIKVTGIGTDTGRSPCLIPERSRSRIGTVQCPRNARITVFSIIYIF